MTRARLLGLVLVVLLLGGCGDAPQQAAPDAPATRTPAEEPEAPPEAEPAPDAALHPGLDFTLPAVGEGQVVGAELAGRSVALWFWAPW